MKLLSIVLTLFTILTVTESIPGDKFQQNVQDSYAEYVYLIDEETVYGDLAFVFGTYKNKYYVACYLYSYNQDAKIYLRIKQNDKIVTFVPDSLAIEGYTKIEEEDFTYCYYKDDNEILIQSFKFTECVAKLKDHPLKGGASGAFPKNKKEVSLITKITLVLIFMLFFTIALALFLIILYKKRVGRFNNMKDENSNQDYIDASFITEGDEESFNNYVNRQKDSYKEPKISKEEIIDRLFKELRSGEITEEELDERLKNLEGDE